MIARHTMIPATLLAVVAVIAAAINTPASAAGEDLRGVCRHDLHDTSVHCRGRRLHGGRKASISTWLGSKSGALGIAALVSGQVQFFDADPFQAVQLRRQGKQILSFIT